MPITMTIDAGDTGLSLLPTPLDPSFSSLIVKRDTQNGRSPRTLSLERAGIRVLCFLWYSIVAFFEPPFSFLFYLFPTH